MDNVVLILLLMEYGLGLGYVSHSTGRAYSLS